MLSLVEAIAKSLVNNPDAVEVREIPGENEVVIELKVAPEDMGKVIGKKRQNRKSTAHCCKGRSNQGK